MSVFNMAAALDLHPNCKANTEDPEDLVDFARHVLSSKWHLHCSHFRGTFLFLIWNLPLEKSRYAVECDSFIYGGKWSLLVLDVKTIPPAPTTLHLALAIPRTVHLVADQSGALPRWSFGLNILAIVYITVNWLSVAKEKSSLLLWFFISFQFKRSKVYITGYGIDTEYRPGGFPEVEPLRPEQYITLWEEDMENAKH